MGAQLFIDLIADALIKPLSLLLGDLGLKHIGIPPFRLLSVIKRYYILIGRNLFSGD